MTIPASPPRRYTVSRQLIGGDDFNNLNDQLNSAQSVTAAGTVQGDAASLTGVNVEVLSGSANNAGIILPVSYPGAQIDILNNSLNTTKVYPAGTDQIQNAGTTYAGASTAITMATLVSIRLICIKKGFWQRNITA